ncbi:energy-coupling factor transporter transmembrane component T [Neobacillus sp. D3-1R]|uniref:energy-coupling factor transporter transmembrane component T n=1 Tax=Neobacillus sp. D3-1R TaxID=3445778 RepID=UPI003F9F8085
MKSRFHSYHPFVTFFYYIGSIALMMLFQHLIFLLIGIFGILAIHFIHDRCKQLQRWLFFILISGLFISIFNPIFNERGKNVLFEFYGHRFTLEATIYGAMSALTIIGVMMLFVSYNEVMTPNKLLYLFSKFLPQFAVLLMLTLRFIPLMKRRLNDISAVQISKGISVSQGSWKERIQKSMLYIQVLLTYSLEEAIQTADSMKARGYGQANRTSYEYFRFKRSDLLAFTFLITLFWINLIGRFNHLGSLTIYPVMEQIPLTSADNVILMVYLLYVCFPLYVEIGGAVKWRLSK